jgi:NTE family protein
MTQWNPTKTRETFNLYLSENEKAAIRANLGTPADDGHIYADAVFEGGGVKGTAFIGALRCFDDVGIKWRKLAGTSAGAITASILATQRPMDELEAIISQLDYNTFLTQKNRFIFNGSPENDLENPIWMLLNLILARQKGQYSSEPFFRWLQEVLGEEVKTFQPFIDVPPDTPWYQQRDLRIVVSDISQKEMVVLPTDLDNSVKYVIDKNTTKILDKPDFPVAEAVRLSMTIPLFFEPGELWRTTSRGASNPQTRSIIVDGGVLSNFPLWIYDAQPNQCPKCPTFGFELVEGGAKIPDDDECVSDDSDQQSSASSENSSEIKGAIGVLGGVLETMMLGRDRRHLRFNDQGRVIDIPTLDVSATAFNLDNDTKDFLYTQGYRAARNFLRTWSWSEHLKSRGFTP